MIDSPTDIISSVLLYLGRDPNSRDPADVTAASAVLMKIRPYVRSIEVACVHRRAANGSICALIGWSGDVMQAKRRALEAGNGVKHQLFCAARRRIDHRRHDGGPGRRPAPANAERWLNYLMRADVMAGITNAVKYPNGNRAALSARREDRCARTRRFIRTHRCARGCIRWSRRRRSTCAGADARMDALSHRPVIRARAAARRRPRAACARSAPPGSPAPRPGSPRANSSRTAHSRRSARRSVPRSAPAASYPHRPADPLRCRPGPGSPVRHRPRAAAAIDQHTAPRRTASAAVCPGATCSDALLPATSRRSQTLSGVKVAAGPRCPAYSPAMTRRVPAPRASATLGICGARIAW
jgi:hypothetical protein